MTSQTTAAAAARPARGGAHSTTNSIVEVLLDAGHVSRDQLAYAHRVQAKLDGPRPILEVLKDLKFISDEQIKAAVRQNPSPMCLGDLLVELGRVREDDLRVALTIQAEREPGKRLGQILLERRLIDERSLIEVLSLQLGFPCVEPDFAEIDPKLFLKVPVKWYETYHFVPVRMEDGAPLIAFADPLEKSDLDAAREVFGPVFTVFPGIYRIPG